MHTFVEQELLDLFFFLNSRSQNQHNPLLTSTLAIVKAIVLGFGREWNQHNPFPGNNKMTTGEKERRNFVGFLYLLRNQRKLLFLSLFLSFLVLSSKRSGRVGFWERLEPIPFLATTLTTGEKGWRDCVGPLYLPKNQHNLVLHLLLFSLLVLSSRRSCVGFLEDGESTTTPLMRQHWRKRGNVWVPFISQTPTQPPCL